MAEDDRHTHKVFIVSIFPRLPKLIKDQVPGLSVVSFLVSGEMLRHTLDTNEIIKQIEESKADIIISFPHMLHILVQAGLNTDALKWFHSCSAGVDELRGSLSKLPEDLICTRMGEGYGGFMAEYVIGQIISREHYFPQMLKDQEQKLWQRTKFIKKRSLCGLTIGILGTGAIGSQIAAICKAFGMIVKGLSRTKKVLPFPNFDILMQQQDLGQFLAGCDYVCSVLPSTPETSGLLSGNVLKACQEKETVLINIGRGDVIDESSLIKALNMKWIAGAIMDANEKEPLTKDSPLWNEPNVVITPHISGPCTTDTIAKVFVSNYKKFIKGDPLDYTVDWQTGY
ncbi:glyoxylate/hydroxypyruvate reductase A-like isoform X1 [Crassostrea virginica]